MKQLSFIFGILIAVKSVSAVTLRDNYFCAFTQGGHPVNLNFKLEDKSVTIGQPFNGVSQVVLDSDGGECLDVQAGRKDSASNVSWVKNQNNIGNYYWSNQYALDVADQSALMPDQLNFAVLGTLSIEYAGNSYVCNDVILGQSNSSHTNNQWWIFDNPKADAVNAYNRLYCTNTTTNSVIYIQPEVLQTVPYGWGGDMSSYMAAFGF